MPDTEFDYEMSKFREDFDMLGIKGPQRLGDQLLNKTIIECRMEKMSRCDTAIRIIETLTCELNKYT